MEAYHNDPGLRQLALESVQKEWDAGLLRGGQFCNRDGERCMIGVLGSASYGFASRDDCLRAFTRDFGLPMTLGASLEIIFEGAHQPVFEVEERVKRCLAILRAIPVGAELDEQQFEAIGVWSYYNTAVYEKVMEIIATLPGKTKKIKVEPIPETRPAEEPQEAPPPTPEPEPVKEPEKVPA